MKPTFLLALSLIAPAAFWAAPVKARTWTAPESCEIFLTVQAKACRVSNHYKCASDASGDQWRADFDQEGLFFMSRIDFETQWVESIEVAGLMSDEVRQYLKPDPADPASFSELLSSGVDSFDFGLSRTDGSDTLVNGFDRLTGQSVTIDGVELKETEFEFLETAPDGSSQRRANGYEYVHPEWRLFFAGPGQTDLGDGQWLPIDGSPVDFIFPGEEGFASSQPIYDCDALTAQGPSTIPVTKAQFKAPQSASPKE